MLQFIKPAIWSLLLGISIPLGAQFVLEREPAGPSSRRTGLVLTEIMYNPRPLAGRPAEETLEYVELYNAKPWAEDLAGFVLDGDVRYEFGPGTVLGPGAYLVVARVPELVASQYGITNLVGPWEGALTNRLSTERGTVRLLNPQGAVLLEVNYADSPPWPEGADGTGHSLVLVRPSCGEGDDRAWGQSDSVGGSPGGPDPVTPDPIASVCLNEWQNHSDPVDWLELYNHGNSPVDLSGAYLSDAPSSNFFRIPDGVSIPARGFVSYDQNQLGFELFAGGESIFLWSSNRARVIDVVDFRGQSNNISSGRWPDGGPIQYGLASPSRGRANNPPMRYALVINEIMYNPPSGNTDEEYVEIYNRSGRAINISGAEFVVGIDYVFPTNSLTSSMPPGAFWVVAKNPEHLRSLHPNLTTNNTFGPYDGTLANGGERLVLAVADYDIVNNGGTSTLEKLPVPVSDLVYRDGGKWTFWSDGQGSSLELIDPEADPHHPSNWADSTDTTESLWTAIEMNVPQGETLGPEVNDRLIVMLQGVGECLLDEIEVRADQGPNLVVNGGFEEGLSGWTLQGSHDFSTVENQGFAGARSLHVRAGSRGDNQSNRILSPPLSAPIPTTARVVSLRAKARWLRGFPELLLRLHGSATEAYGRMAVPGRLGTPGATNSQYQANVGPAVFDVRHTPALPQPGQPAVVTARASDSHGLSALVLRYRVDPELAYMEIPLLDSGTAGDAVAGDGVYSSTIPAQAEGAIVAFYVQGQDTLGARGTFPRMVFPPPGLTRCWPNDAVARECVIRWGEVQMPGDFATYHLWITSLNSNRWHTRDAMNNTELDGTFVYNNTRIIYNALPLFSGSPWHRTNALTGPAGPNRVDYEMNFPDDDPLLGSTDFVLNNPGNPDGLTVSDLSALTEQTVYRVFAGMGLPHNHRRYIHLFVNGSQRSTAHERPGNFIFEDSQQPNGEMIEEWFAQDPGGQLFKVEDWFEFDHNGFDVAAHRDADLSRRTVLIEDQPTFVPGPYRYLFRKRSGGVGSSDNDFAALYELIDAVSPAADPESPAVDPDTFAAVADWEEWMRHFAVQRAVGNWDSYGWERGKNDYLYRAGRGFVHMPWDIDYSLGLGRPAAAPLFESNDPRVRAMFNTPAIARAYWRAFAELVAGPFRNEYLDPFVDARAEALVNNQINIDPAAVAAVKWYIGERRAFLEDQLGSVTVPFAVEGSAGFTTNSNLVEIQGTAPIAVKEITLNGVVYPVRWTSVTRFSVRVVLAAETNELTLEGLDRLGQPVAGASQSLSVTYTGPVTDPVGAIVLNEIMFAPGTPGGQYLEIVNRSAMHFDLSGWRLEEPGYVFPPGSIVAPGQILVLAEDPVVFGAGYGGVDPFDRFDGTLSSQGQMLRLVRPGATDDLVVDAVRYGVRPPWPARTAGCALQLIDAAQDNSRVSNWTVDPFAPATPGAPNSVAEALWPYDPLWLNEIQCESLVGPVDNAGDAEPWLELYNAGLEPLLLQDYYLADDFTTNLQQWAFPAGTTIEPGEFKLIWVDGEPEESTVTDLHTAFRLAYAGQVSLVRLVDGQPQIVDYLSWKLPYPNVSYGAHPDGQAPDRSFLYEPSPGGPNGRRIPSLFINEWMARNSAALPDPADFNYEDWFELYNGEEQTIDLGGYYLTDNLANPTQFLIPNNGRYRIPPHGFLLVWADDEADQNRADRADLHVNFQLAVSAGDIGLFSPDGQRAVDLLSYGSQTNDLSEGRFTDGASQRYFLGDPTPRGPNLLSSVNLRPVFPALPDRVVYPGTINTYGVRATDPQAPPQILTHSIVSGPPGSLINPGGAYRWIVPASQPPGEYPVTLRVTDNGTPSLDDTVTFFITVRSPDSVPEPSPPALIWAACLGNQMTFTIQAQAGRSYRVERCEDLGLPAPVWTPVGPDFVAANATASFTVVRSETRCFYRAVQLD